MLQPENQGGSFIEEGRSKRQKRVFERNGVYVLPCWVVKQTSQKRLAPLKKAYPNDRHALPVSPVTSAEANVDASVEESGPVRSDESGSVRADESADDDMVQEA